MKTVKINVGSLVSFLYASGDLSSETFQNVSLLEGTRAHQYHQRNYLEADEAEVSIALMWTNASYQVFLTGRIDGLLQRGDDLIVEEIKSTRFNIFDENWQYKLEHLAQLKMYAFMYMKANHLTDIKGRLTYLQISDLKSRIFDFVFDVDLLKTFFETSILDYLDWIEILSKHDNEKRASLETLVFPFSEYRRGQRELMAATYQTTMNEEILYAIAPTGIGKTMATLFASLKAMHKEEQKIFYLTAKNAGKKVALESMDVLSEAGLKMKTLEITSKDTICFLDKRLCHPDHCSYAKGFFDRLKDATIDIFEHETLLTRTVVERYAQKHRVCPFEFSLYVSYFVDVIICDYNYVFCPITHLIRYFDDDQYAPHVLIDEAHNMITRSREMYTKSLSISTLVKVRRLSNKMKPSLRGPINRVIDVFSKIKEGMGKQTFLSFKETPFEMIDAIKYCLQKMENTLKDQKNQVNRSDVIDIYLELLGFMKIHDYYGSQYLTNVLITSDDDVMMTLQCLDASKFIYHTIEERVKSTVLFSATLEPVSYYKQLLTTGVGETIKIRSPFDPKHLKLFVMHRISTRYQDRASSLQAIVKAISVVVQAKKGNYIVFFPSYQYLNNVKASLPNDLDVDIIIQDREMDALLRTKTIELFKDLSSRSKLALFVMGGSFSEGIDYIGDMLNGVIVVGVGLPMVNDINHQLKDYYEEHFGQGFDFAYKYPGINKVIQAVGRVIRTHQDYGIAVLIDDRFSKADYEHLFPREWEQIEKIDHTLTLSKSLKNFWAEMNSKF
jgi:DNA excision repair protein ERCC-2